MMMALALTGITPGDDKDKDKIDGKKLIGKWVSKEETKGDVKRGIEFTKDGKMKIFAGADTIFEGTYNLAGNKLTLQVKAGENEIKKTVTVIKLTDEEFEGEGDEGKKTFKRIKDK